MTRSDEQALCGVCQAPYATHADGACPPSGSAPVGPDLGLEPQKAAGADAAASGADAAAVSPARAEPAADRPVYARSATATAWLTSAEPKPGPELSNGQAVTGLILGILSVFCCWLGLIAAALVLLSLAFSIIGILRARLHFSDGFGVAVAGVVFGVAGLGLYLAFGALGLGMGFRL